MNVSSGMLANLESQGVRQILIQLSILLLSELFFDSFYLFAAEEL